MAEENVFDALDDRTETPVGGGDYADWWDPDEDGSHLVGIVVEKHSAPREWTDDGEVPDVIHTVMSLGRGDFDAGRTLTPKQHKQIKNGLAGCDLDDLVNLKFTGYEKVNGNVMHTYEVGVIPNAEWTEMAGSDEIQEVLDEYYETDGLKGDNTRDKPYRSKSAPSQPDSGGDDGDDSEAEKYLINMLDVQGGDMTVEQADQMMNDVQDYDVDVEKVAVSAGLKVNDGVITV